MYSFPRANVIKYHKSGGLKTAIYSLNSGAGFLKSRCQQGQPPAGTLGRTLPASSQLLVVAVGPWQVKMYKPQVIKNVMGCNVYSVMTLANNTVFYI